MSILPKIELQQKNRFHRPAAIFWQVSHLVFSHAGHTQVWKVLTTTVLSTKIALLLFQIYTVTIRTVIRGCSTLHSWPNPARLRNPILHLKPIGNPIMHGWWQVRFLSAAGKNSNFWHFHHPLTTVLSTKIAKTQLLEAVQDFSLIGMSIFVFAQALWEKFKNNSLALCRALKDSLLCYQHQFWNLKSSWRF